MLEKLFPEEYKKRLSELATEKADWSRKIPLFLCGSPMFPGQPLSLHLFESRYRLMIQRVLQSNKRFGVIASEKLKPGDVGVVFEITECQFLPDGRALCESIGRSRFVLREFWIEDGTQGLHYATIDDLEDEKDIFEKPEFVPPQLPRPHTRDSDDTLPPMQRMDEDPDADDSLEFALAMSQQPLDSLFAKKKDSQDAYCQRVAYLTNIVRETMKEFMHFMPHLKTQLDKHYGPMPGGLEGTTSPTAPNFLSEASKLTFWIASILPLPAAMKLQMLGCKSLLARLDMSISALRSLLDDIRRKAAEPVPPSPQQSPAASQPHQTAQFAAEAQNPQYNVDYAPRGQSIPASIQYSAQPYEAITTLRQSGTGPTFL
jgi:Lon protease-like protein